MNVHPHRIIIAIYALIVLISMIILTWHGYSYYRLPVENRFFDPHYELLKPSGGVGHGLGIAGAFLILTGLVSYSLRKRVKTFHRWGRLKYWLDFHIFLCTWGSVLVVFHTSFKFGGFIAIGFWSLVIVWISGVVGRFLYLQIPRSIEGGELTLNELLEEKKNLANHLREHYGINFTEIRYQRFSKIRLKLISNHIPKKEFRNIRHLIKKQRVLEKKIQHLEQMRKLFHFWHLAHLPFATFFVVLLFIHVGVVLFFGYKWIF